MTRTKSLAAAAAVLAMGGIAQAALVKNGDGTVTDTTTQLIWLQNWDVNGKQNWATQKAWANDLNFAGGLALGAATAARRMRALETS